MAPKNTKKRKMLTPEQRQNVIDSKGKVTGPELAKKYGISAKAIYNTWSRAEKKSTAKKKASGNSGKGKRLSPEQRQDILNKKGKVSATDLAKEYSVNVNTIYNVWKKTKKQGKKAKVAAAPAKKSVNPNQNRIDFCNKWIALLQDEVKRLESEPDMLKEAEAALSKVIG